MSTLGMSFTRKVTRRAVGCAEGNKKKIAVAFYKWMFRDIERAARLRGVSFQEEVRTLCSEALSARQTDRLLSTPDLQVHKVKE